MPAARILALAFCSYLTPALRKPLRTASVRCSDRLHGAVTSYTGLSAFPHGRPAVKMSSATMTATTSTSASAREDESATASPEDLGVRGSVGLETAAEVYRYLRGRWDLEKSIDYKAGGMAGTWQGVATFDPAHPGASALTTPPAAAAKQATSPGGEGGAVQNVSRASPLEGGGEICARSGRDASPGRLLLRYLERGVFRVNGMGDGFEAGQRLVYDCGDGSGTVRVHFVDDPQKPDALRFFHELDFRSPSTTGAVAGASKAAAAVSGEETADYVSRPRAEFEHLCIRDMYRGQVEVVGPDEFRTRWEYGCRFAARPGVAIASAWHSSFVVLKYVRRAWWSP